MICRLYILEGIITVFYAACCIFLVPKSYETAYFLNDEDKAIMRHRAEVSEEYSGGSGHYSKKDLKEAAKDVKSWLHGVIQICVVTILYGEFPVFSLVNETSNLQRRFWYILAHHHQEWFPLFNCSSTVFGNSR